MTTASVKKQDSFVVAIDGPAASGKSTTAKLVAKTMGWLYMDTGAMYRALAVKALQLDIPLNDGPALEKMARKTEVVLKPVENGLLVFLDGTDVTDAIRTPDVDRAVGPVCEVAGVREVLVELQRQMGRKSCVVAEGRDMGTVVFPDADLKYYIEASLEERAARRKKDFEKRGIQMELDEIKVEIEKRDKRDSGREHSPLVRAEDATVIDTTCLGVDEQVQLILHDIYRKADIKPEH